MISSATDAAAPAAASAADVRAYWDRRPCNIRHSRLAVGTREYFDQVEARKYMVEPHIPGFARFPRWSGKRVLEIGCGIGTDAVNYARAGTRYTTVELSEVSLALTRQRFAAFGLEGEFYCANAEQLTEVLGRRGFDLVYKIAAYPINGFEEVHPMPDWGVCPMALRQVQPVGSHRVHPKALRQVQPMGQWRLRLWRDESLVESGGGGRSERARRSRIAARFGPQQGVMGEGRGGASSEGAG